MQCKWWFVKWLLPLCIVLLLGRVCRSELSVGLGHKSLRAIDRGWGGEVVGWKLCLESHGRKSCGPSSIALFMRLRGQTIPGPKVCSSAGVPGPDHKGGQEESHLRMHAIGSAQAQGPGIPWPYTCPCALEHLGRVAQVRGVYAILLLIWLPWGSGMYLPGFSVRVYTCCQWHGWGKI